LLADPRNPNSLSTRLRKRRDVQLRALISAIAAEKGGINILDMGGTLEYWQRVGIDFLRRQNASITLLNLRSSDISEIPRDMEMFRKIVGNACRLDEFSDGHFDLAHSNSVIEHVETWANMKSFAAETRRVGRNYYVQTPYFWFPFDPHYYRMPMFHWFPRPVRARLLNSLPLATIGRIEGVDLAFDVVDRARLLDGRQFRFLFPDAKVSFERFGGLAKSMVAIRRQPGNGPGAG